jgi:hypothetical protein
MPLTKSNFYRIQAGWSYQISKGKLVLENGQLRRKITLTFDCSTHVLEQVAQDLYLGETFPILAEKLRRTQKPIEECYQILEALKLKKILIPAEVLQTHVQDIAFDRLKRFLNTFETDLYSGAEFLTAFQSKTVVLIGIGSYGCVLAEALVRMGIGRLIAFDHDIVEFSNLDRQCLFGREDVGDKKISAAERSLKRIGTKTVLEFHDKKICETEDLKRMISTPDLIINTFGYLHPEYPGQEIPQVIAQAALECRIPCLTLGGAHLGPLWLPGQSGCHLCFLEMMKNRGILFHPDRRSPAIRKRMCYPITASLSHLAVWEITCFLAGILPSRVLGRVLHFDWFSNSPYQLLQLDSSRCGKCS